MKTMAWILIILGLITLAPVVVFESRWNGLRIMVALPFIMAGVVLVLS